MSIIIENAGALTTVQDLGRHGYMGLGFPPCGALDEQSFRLANALAGNEANAAALEMTLLGVTARFTAPGIIALTGADFGATLNAAPLALNTPVPVNAGDRLACGMATQGLRGSLAIAGGIDVPLVMGSRSTHLKCGIGGFEGRKLASGDELAIGGQRGAADSTVQEITQPISRSNPQIIRAIAGPEEDLFSGEALAQFFSAEFTLSPQCDRMGIRLDGEPIPAKSGTDIISTGIAAGSVQVPSSGLPIILLADRQTVGGYAKIATVIRADLPLLAQMRPGDKLQFRQVSVQEAQRGGL
jgi:biotin-dependent carboxylase-like uncharacterized protein